MAATKLDEDPLAGSVLRTVRILGTSDDNTVVLASNSFTGQLVAVKLVSRGFDSPRAKYLLRELLNHYELTLAKHPHIVSLLDVFLTPRHMAIVMEYVDGENLQVFTEKAGGCIIEPLARFLFQQIVIALDFCHRRGKVNRGIRPTSLLLQLSASALPLLKLSDFSLSKDTLRHSEPRSQVGTAMFCAPEVLQNFKGAPYDAAAVDVWGIGVVLFMMLYGRHPFSRPEDASLNAAQQVIAMFKRVTAPAGSPEGDLLIPPQLPTSVLAGAPPGAPISMAAADLLRGLLARDPRSRLTLDGVEQHEWFRTGLPEGAALLNDVVAAEEQAAGSAAVMQPTVAAQLERMVVAAATGPVAAPQQQLSGGGGGAAAHGDSTDGPASSSAQTGLSSLTEATLGGAGGGANGAFLSASPASGAPQQHPQPTPAPNVPGWTVTTSGTSDAAVASVSIGSTVPGRPGASVGAASHSTAAAARSSPLMPAAPQHQHQHQPLIIQSDQGGLVSMMADLATPMPWSPLEAGSGAAGAGGMGGMGGMGGGSGGGGGDLLDDLEALVMGLPEDEIDMSAASLDFLMGAQQQQHTPPQQQQPLALAQPPPPQQHQHMHYMPHGPSPLQPHPQNANAHPALQQWKPPPQQQHLNHANPQPVDHAMGVNASAPSSADVSALAGLAAGTAASPPHPAAGAGGLASGAAGAAATMAPGAPRIVAPPALFTSLHTAAATAVDATAGLLSRLRTDSLPSPSTLAVVDAQPFLLGGGGGSGSVRHGGGAGGGAGAGGGGSGSGGSGASLIHRGGSLAWLHNDGSIVTIPSTYSMDWCTLSARSQTLLNAPDLAMLQAGSGSGAPMAVGGAAPGGAAASPAGGGVGMPDAGAGGGDSNSPALVQGSVWHRICNDAKGALKGVATEARGLGRAAAAVAGLGSTAGVITTGAASQRSKGR
ncbi:hypothetical protein HXX76_003628 [Chlamydomonas incerta]|uniref:Protein kinase domain-containing protein n=1 Tax=Chlamydomonas incerta TaxID=51695 RepID=A0A835W4Z0_CHLIN|nr:hypothetical protein HXX76_003628 [Chlamydomonas incerta]|eukprot:KAG2440772.1 hypothetical protein HXX76_003628 [Chlamydomonas incerta]